MWRWVVAGVSELKASKCILGELTSACPVLKVHKPDSICWRATVSIWALWMNAWGNGKQISFILIKKEKRPQISWQRQRGKTGGRWGGSQGEVGKWMVKLSRLIIETEGSSAPQEIEMQRKKSRSSAWELLGISLLHKRWHRQDPEEKGKKKPSAPLRTSYRSDCEVSYNTSLRSATAGLLLKHSTISYEQYFDVLETHMGLMQCGD